MNNEIENIENSFDISFLKKNFADISVDVAESIIDSLIDNVIIKEIPVVKTIYAIGKTILGMKQLAFTRRVLKFLLYTDDLPVDEKRDFLLSLNEETENRATEVILHILDQIDNDKKVRILSNLLHAKIRGFIPIETFLKLSQILKSTFYQDLEKLEDYYGGRGYDGHNGGITHSLIGTGLVYFPLSNINLNKNRISLSYDLTDSGKALLKYGFGKDLN